MCTKIILKINYASRSFLAYKEHNLRYAQNIIFPNLQSSLDLNLTSNTHGL
jgi:hypothetical protein